MATLTSKKTDKMLWATHTSRESPTLIIIYMANATPYVAKF